MALYNGAFGSRESALETLVQATPLILTGLAGGDRLPGRGLEHRRRGAVLRRHHRHLVVCTTCGEGLPAPLLFVAMLVAAALVGAAWASVAGGLLVRYGTNEILTTVMLNFVILKVTVLPAGWALAVSHNPLLPDRKDGRQHLPAAVRL